MLAEERERVMILVGEENMLELCRQFANKRLPGKRFRNQILRARFKKDLEGLDLRSYAEKYGVSMSTLYKWLH